MGSSSVCILNFGCRVNQAENMRLEEDLRSRGASIAEDYSAATHVIINTCAVTESAENQVRRIIRRIARDRPDTKIFLAGCTVDRDGESLRRLPGVAGVFRNADKETIAESLVPSPSRIVPAFEKARTRPMLKIQDGCNLACAFCIIPALRGRVLRSVPPAEVARRVAAYGQAGYPEVILTGILLGAYGADLRPRVSLAELLAALEGHGPPLRISSIEPWRLTAELVEVLGSAPHIRPHFHIPIQSGSRSVLKRMNRWMESERVRAIVARLRELAPAASIGTDIIAGFPGETDRELEETVRFMSEARFTYFHVFSYSQRPATAAAGMTSQVPREVVRERSARLRALSAAADYSFRKRFEGEILNAVVLARGGPEGERAVTANGIKVRVAGHPAPGAARVRIAAVQPDATFAVIVAG